MGERALTPKPAPTRRKAKIKMRTCVIPSNREWAYVHPRNITCRVCGPPPIHLPVRLSECPGCVPKPPEPPIPAMLADSFLASLTPEQRQTRIGGPPPVPIPRELLDRTIEAVESVVSHFAGTVEDDVPLAIGYGREKALRSVLTSLRALRGDR